MHVIINYFSHFILVTCFALPLCSCLMSRRWLTNSVSLSRIQKSTSAHVKDHWHLVRLPKKRQSLQRNQRLSSSSPLLFTATFKSIYLSVFVNQRGSFLLTVPFFFRYQLDRVASSVPHTRAETPRKVTHNHDEDDSEEESDKST